jgi:HSP20 family molecular chaperone IbpA
MATLLQTARGFARRALAGVSGHRVEVQPMRSPGPRPDRPVAWPAVEMADEPRKLIVVFQVPGATTRNTLVCWDEDVHTLAVRVALAAERDDSPSASNASGDGDGGRAVSRAGARARDWYAEVVLPADVDPLRGSCSLGDGTLRVEAPHRDTPAATALPLPVIWKPLSLPTIDACVA